jgi:hypothetical protein
MGEVQIVKVQWAIILFILQLTIFIKYGFSVLWTVQVGGKCENST